MNQETVRNFLATSASYLRPADTAWLSTPEDFQSREMATEFVHMRLLVAQLYPQAVASGSRSHAQHYERL